MKGMNILQLQLILTGIAMLSLGCTAGIAREAARSGAHHVTVLETDLATKINAENTYYERIQAMSIEDVDRTDVILIQDKLTRASRSFIASYANISDDDRLVAALRTYLKDFLKDRRQSEAELQTILAQVETQLAEGRQQLSTETAKLAQLQSKLRVLGESRTGRDLLEFLVAYGKATKEELDRIQADAKKAAEKAEKAAEQKEAEKAKKAAEKNSSTGSTDGGPT